MNKNELNNVLNVISHELTVSTELLLENDSFLKLALLCIKNNLSMNKTYDVLFNHAKGLF